MRNRTRAMAVGLSLAASVLLLQGSALGAAPGNDRGGRTMTFHVVFATVQLHRSRGARSLSSGRDRLP